MGVYDAEFIPVVAETLARLGSVRAIVMHSVDGLDEFSLGAPSKVAQVDEGRITEYVIDPEELGLQTCPFEELQARDLDHAVELVRDTISGHERGPARDLVILNAGAAIHASGLSDSIESGLSIAAQSIDFGDANRTLETLTEVSNLPE